jgi:hypothetical protein
MKKYLQWMKVKLGMKAKRVDIAAIAFVAL